MHGDPGQIGTHPFIHPGPTWAQLVQSRRGYQEGNPLVLTFDNACPTFFANPFRAAGAGELVPFQDLLRPDVETTLLRSDFVPAAGAGVAHPVPNGNPLFAFRPAGQQLYRDSDRNPYFRYQPIYRIGNLVSASSNVYAVWITVGFFEAEPTNNTAVHPDGYRLAQEVGSDTGDIKRQRAFYIIDRSIPVAFEPGLNHNVDRAVVLRRFIE